MSTTPLQPSRPTATVFAHLVDAVSGECRRIGLRAPGFRSPPAAGLQRSIRRSVDGSCTVSIAVRGRDVDAIAHDVVDGVLVANRLDGASAESTRRQMLEVVLSNAA